MAAKKVLMSGTALLTLGALTAVLSPRLAMDAKVDLRPAVAGLTDKNFKERKPAIVEAVRKALEGKLAKDANIDDVTEVLDALQAQPVVAAVAAAAGGDPEGSTDPIPPKDAVDASPLDKIKEFLRAQGVADDVLAQLDGMMAAPAADEFPPKKDDDKKDDDKKDKKLAADEPPPFKGKPEVGKGPPITKPAMDAAIADAVKVAVQTQRDIKEAEKAVRPYVGEIAVAFDSAEEVYKSALASLGVKVEGVHPSAFKAILEMQPKPGHQKQNVSLGMDAAQSASFEKRFPGAGKIQVY